MWPIGFVKVAAEGTMVVVEQHLIYFVLKTFTGTLSAIRNGLWQKGCTMIAD